MFCQQAGYIPISGEQTTLWSAVQGAEILFTGTEKLPVEPAEVSPHTFLAPSRSWYPNKRRGTACICTFKLATRVYGIGLLRLRHFHLARANQATPAQTRYDQLPKHSPLQFTNKDLVPKAWRYGGLCNQTRRKRVDATASFQQINPTNNLDVIRNDGLALAWDCFVVQGYLKLTKPSEWITRQVSTMRRC